MPSRRIAPREWGPFLESFAAQHLGVVCDVEVDDPPAGVRLRARRMVFRGLICDPEGTVRVLEVFVGDRAETHMTCVRSTPGSLSVDEDDQGEVRALRFDARRGVFTLHLARGRTPSWPWPA